jgi:hypothetical protein
MCPDDTTNDQRPPSSLEEAGPHESTAAGNGFQQAAGTYRQLHQLAGGPFPQIQGLLAENVIDVLAGGDVALAGQTERTAASPFRCGPRSTSLTGTLTGRSARAAAGGRPQPWRTVLTATSAAVGTITA